MSFGLRPSRSATTCAIVVSWPCPKVTPPVVANTVPSTPIRTRPPSVFPPKGKKGFINRAWPKLLVPESRVEPMPMPMRLPLPTAASFSALAPS